MRAAGVVVASFLLVFAGLVRVARAQPGQTAPSPAGAGSSTTPAAAPSAAPADPPPALVGFAVGADGHLGFGDSSELNGAVRGELVLVGHHAIVARVGAGTAKDSGAESYDPTYSERFARIGYRLVATRLYMGVEFGRSWTKARWEANGSMPAHSDPWFGENTVTALIGWKLGGVDIGFDYTNSTPSNFGIYLGAGYRSP